MRFIKVTKHENEINYVNVNCVLQIREREDSSGSIIHFGLMSIHVKETPQELINLIYRIESDDK